MRRSRFGKGIALVLVAAVGALSAGCFGKFQLTRKVYDINQSIDEKYVRSAATWIFVIVQVYTVAALLDLIVFNVLEFWTGENPVASGTVTKVVRAWDREDGHLLLPRRVRDGGGDRAVRRGAARSPRSGSATTGGERSPRWRRRREEWSARFPRSRRPTDRWT